jgi:long-subunit acyl-CoA synthetase (AMP-forming)
MSALAQPSLCGAFQETVAKHAASPALRAAGSPESAITWGEYGQRVERIAHGFHALGVRRGDAVALLLTNRPEFHLVDAALMHLGAVPFSVYPTSSPEQIEYVLRDASVRVLVTERALAQRGMDGATRAGGLQHKVVVDWAGDDSLEDLEARAEKSDLDFSAAWRAVEPSDLLTLIYTSGTTGPPKGVRITHANVLAATSSFRETIPFPEGARVVSYLPAAHIAERDCSQYLPMLHGFSVTTCPALPDLGKALVETRPDWFFGVPRVFEKFKAAIESGPGGEPEQIRAAIGLDRVAALNVAAAPTSVETLEFFHGIGLPVAEMWGMSETSGAGACNRFGEIRIGTVGPPAPGVEMRLADDGELLVRGPAVMEGYHNKPEETAEAIDSDGWLHTGDIGAFDDAGHLSIVDRKKELIINSAGKNMSPAAIEAKLRAASPLVEIAVAIGDRRPYNVALIVPNREVAEARGMDDEAIQNAIATAVASANERLARVEQIKRFCVVGDTWAPGGRELTPTMKLKRREIAAAYGDEIEALYATEGAKQAVTTH